MQELIEHWHFVTVLLVYEALYLFLLDLYPILVATFRFIYWTTFNLFGWLFYLHLFSVFSVVILIFVLLFDFRRTEIFVIMIILPLGGGGQVNELLDTFLDEADFIEREFVHD